MEIENILFNKNSIHEDDVEIIQLLSSHPNQDISATELKLLLDNNLSNTGWLVPYKYSPQLKTTIKAVRDKTGLCLPLGNIARLFYDLLKMQYCYNVEVINRGIIICPIKPIGNKAYLNRLDRELSVYKKVINIPLCGIGVNIKES
ncbi:MAG: hypothetical protein HQ521_19585 [Bacteroidetes bacterium]|nr:hypothetical protein [Bacteroidota bacterium]